MLINLKVKTLDAQTHELSIDNEITVREFKDKVAEKTNISAEQQRIIYCGRVLADEKQLKEYDVDGKVVHVAERPPPSARGPSSNTPPPGGDNPPRRTARGMRNSPLFRALDGMVVGTMAIPMNTGVNNMPMQLNPFTSSSSFCMNRITVARHMLECANNIAAFLEDPSRGLNNTSLDILAQGRWTMESTVVEVGITAADIPQEQNIVHMLEGAVSAALRRNGNTNVTVVQLPTVFGSSENPDGTHTSSETTALVVEEPMDDTLDDSAESGALNTSTSTEEMETANEDEVPSAEETAPTTSHSPTVSSGAAATAGTSSSATSLGSTVSGGAASGSTTASTSSSTTGNTVTVEQNSSPRRTGTNILADVIDQMRAVQTRLNPFIEQFYDILRNEPTFDENDTTGRSNTQRLYDRVSEAFHYMSHAQHAISDLLLDVSQPAPRYLACRPILVEQSGYMSSNNYLSAAAAAAAAGLGNLGGAARQQPQQQQPGTQSTPQRGTQSMSLRGTPSMSLRGTQSMSQRGTPSTPQSGTQSASSQTQAQTQSQSSQTRSDMEAAPATTYAENTVGAITPVEDPIDEPAAPPTPVTNAVASVRETNANPARNENHQMQVARLIEAVVNSAPIDAEFHVQINAPSIVAFGVHPNTSPTDAAANTEPPQQQQEQQRQTTAESEAEPPLAGANASNSAGSGADENTAERPNQARATTATLPTTATQTRSTSRPHVQIGNLPSSGGWNGRVIPANMISSFDRFLPCNSHHVRDTQTANTNANANANANSVSGRTTGGATLAQLTPSNARINHRLRAITDLFRNVPARYVQPPSQSGTRSGRTPTAHSAPAAAATVSRANATTETSPPPASTTAGADSETQRRAQLRLQLLHFITEHMFEGVPIGDDTMVLAVNKAIRWLYDVLIFLPHYDLPEYDSRDSIENLLRHSLPVIINWVNCGQENPTQFEQRLNELCAEFVKRLFSILAVCAGRANAELYWSELMRTLVESLRSNFRGEALQFLLIYVNTKIPTTTDTNDAQQFLVHRNPDDDSSETDTDVEMADVATTSRHSVDYSPDESDLMQFDTAVLGSEPWHSSFPAPWVPVISRDMQRQRDMPSTQAPFSDAYISGMSAKRRKMVQSSKPGSDIKSLVTDSVQQAIRAAGVSTSTASNQSLTPDEVTATIAADVNVQASYSETLRASVRNRLQTDVDFKPDRFPQTSKFLNK